MACSRRRSIPVVLLPLLLAAANAAAPAASGARLAPAPALGLAERLVRLEEVGSQQCWEAMMELKSCTGEIILLLLNGEAYLGPSCCRAVGFIGQRCWGMLSIIGFTPEEGDMLKGYCDDDEAGGPHQQGPPPALDRAAARESAPAAVLAPRKSLARHH